MDILNILSSSKYQLLFTEIGSPLHQKVPICVFHITHNRSHHHGLFVKQNCNHSNTEPSANINHTKICFWQSGTHKTLLPGKKRMEQHFRGKCRIFRSICRLFTNSIYELVGLRVSVTKLILYSFIFMWILEIIFHVLNIDHGKKKQSTTPCAFSLYSLAWPSWLGVSGLLSCWKRNDAFS